MTLLFCPSWVSQTIFDGFYGGLSDSKYSSSVEISIEHSSQTQVYWMASVLIFGSPRLFPRFFQDCSKSPRYNRFPISWGCRTHRLHLCKGVFSLRSVWQQTSSNLQDFSKNNNDRNSAVVKMVSILPLVSYYTSFFFPKHLGTVPNATITTGITVTLFPSWLGVAGWGL